MASVIGLRLDSLVQVDSGLASTPGGVWIPGQSFDLGPDTAPQSVGIAAQFAIANGGTTDGYHLRAWVQWSDNGTTWPDNNQGTLVAVHINNTGGASITKSKVWDLPRPLLRYGRLCYVSDNVSDTLTITSHVAMRLYQAA